MPQIGWFEILVIVVLAVVIIGPKDFPIVLKKIGGWIGSMKRYFGTVQRDITNMENSIEDEISIEKNYTSLIKDKNKDER